MFKALYAVRKMQFLDKNNFKFSFVSALYERGKGKKNLFFEVLCFISRLYFSKTFYVFQTIYSEFCWLYKLSLFLFFQKKNDIFQTINSELYWLYKLSLFYWWETGGFNFLLNFFAVFRNSMNVIANVKKLFGFFVIDGKGRVGIRAIL